jgi:leucyl/phenylalanyl-tRNA--protein transferase
MRTATTAGLERPSAAAVAQRMGELPDPCRAPAGEPAAVGEDLTPTTLVAAYRLGLFPWPAGGRVWWWSPDPRALLPLDGLHVPRSLGRTLARSDFRCTVDQAFEWVMAGCADRPGEGTWITPAMQRAYTRLHQLGRAHSVEVWDGGGCLVGGLYGVAVGATFSGESMFHRVSDASKVALVETARRLREGGFTVFDVQQDTPHLRRFGAVAVPRQEFLRELAAARDREAVVR